MATLRFAARLWVITLGACAAAAAPGSQRAAGPAALERQASPAGATSASSTPSAAQDKDPAAIMAEVARVYRSSDTAAARVAQLTELAGRAWPYLDGTQRRSVYQVIAALYREALVAGTAAQPHVEDRLLAPGYEPEFALRDMIAACYDLAKRNLRPALVDQCAAQTADITQDNQLVAERERLLGTALASRSDWAAARSHLESAAVAFMVDDDPEMFAALARAQRGVGAVGDSCQTVERLWLAHPHLPALGELLPACVQARPNLLATLGAEAKRQFLAEALPRPIATPMLSLEGPALENVDLNLAEGGKVTVLVFFSTWCPHCAAELPRVVEFAKRVAADARLAPLVRVIGVRTAVERESEPYDAFARRMGINFQVLTDPVMSLALARYCGAVGLPPALPALAVVDKAGFVRFVLEPGAYKDTTRDLLWAVEAVLGAASKL